MIYFKFQELIRVEASLLYLVQDHLVLIFIRNILNYLKGHPGREFSPNFSHDITFFSGNWVKINLMGFLAILLMDLIEI